LAQLSSSDELIVVDDASTDDTINKISRLDDSRIVLLRNTSNQGILRTFQRVLEAAKNEIVFISDQDDLWLPGKVERYLEEFRRHPDVTLLVSDASLINERGEILRDSFFSWRGPFRAGVVANIIKNKYLGCTMAFRRDMRNYYLPFPQDVPMHDVWIGLVNQLCGKVLFIDQPMISYRRHTTNLSLWKHGGVLQLLKWRWPLLRNFVRYWWNHVSGQSRCLRKEYASHRKL
jgi:glycosyltransferase involved in cell wall biosynthesis